LLATATASALLLAGCAVQQHKADTAASASADTTSYACENGATIVASYPDVDSAIIQYQGGSHALHIAKSASGARYVGGDIEWWTKGSGAGSRGTLFRHNEDGTSGQRLAFCTAE